MDKPTRLELTLPLPITENKAAENTINAPNISKRKPSHLKQKINNVENKINSHLQINICDFQIEDHRSVLIIIKVKVKLINIYILSEVVKLRDLF